MLEEAKSECDVLIVGLQSDPTIDRPDSKNKPIQTMYERFIHLMSISGVDMIVPYQTEAEIEEILSTLPINVRYIGEDYIGKPFTGKQLCEDLGIEIIYTSRKHNFSTTQLRKRVKEAETKND